MTNLIENYPNITFIIFLIVVFIFLVPISNIIIRSFLKKIFENKEKNCCTTCDKLLKEQEDKTGRIIGMYERILYFLGIYTNNWTLITLIIALKSIARYKKLDDKEFAEKFLVGTLISLLSAIIIGYSFIGVNSYFNTDKNIKKIFDNSFNIKIVDSNQTTLIGT